ncbi:hypothetical protein HDV05_001089, partial [Chytridiales sp. JEL 0842]
MSSKDEDAVHAAADVDEQLTRTIHHQDDNIRVADNLNGKFTQSDGFNQDDIPLGHQHLSAVPTALNPLIPSSSNIELPATTTPATTSSNGMSAIPPIPQTATTTTTTTDGTYTFGMTTTSRPPATIPSLEQIQQVYGIRSRSPSPFPSSSNAANLVNTTPLLIIDDSHNHHPPPESVTPNFGMRGLQNRLRRRRRDEKPPVPFGGKGGAKEFIKWMLFRRDCAVFGFAIVLIMGSCILFSIYV